MSAFVATFALYPATFLYAGNNTKSVLAGGAVGSLGTWLGIPVRCDLASQQRRPPRAVLKRAWRVDALSFIRILAQADRAGHGNIGEAAGLRRQALILLPTLVSHAGAHPPLARTRQIGASRRD